LWTDVEADKAVTFQRIKVYGQVEPRIGGKLCYSHRTDPAIEHYTFKVAAKNDCSDEILSAAIPIYFA
jgi:hypothetical protein